MKLPGGAMLYCLMISLVSGGLMGSYLLLNSLQQRFLDREYATVIAQDNMLSGLSLFRSTPEATYMTDSLFGSVTDSFEVTSEPWGLFQLVQAKGVHGTTTIGRSALLAQQPTGLWKAGLFLADQGFPLLIAGDVHLSGDLYLPRAGLQTGYVHGKGFSGQQTYHGTLHSSFLKEVKAHSSCLQSIRDSLTQISQEVPDKEQVVLRNVNQKNDWNESAFCLQSPYRLAIEASLFAGKCILHSSHELIIGADTEINHGILFARKITFQSGFQGRVQAFATESITLESGVELAYPSVLYVAGGRITLSENCDIEGAVLLDHPISSSTNIQQAFCHVAKGTQITGHLLCQGVLELRGSVKGHVMTDQFILKTPATTFQNYMLDARIEGGTLGPSYLMPLLQENAPLEILEWL